MNCNDSKPLRCDILIPVTSDPSNCDAEPCGFHASVICELCGLALCSDCVAEFPCFHGKNGQHLAASEFALYSGRVQPDYRSAALYRKAAIQAAKEPEFRGSFLRLTLDELAGTERGLHALRLEISAPCHAGKGGQ